MFINEHFATSALADSDLAITPATELREICDPDPVTTAARRWAVSAGSVRIKPQHWYGNQT